MTTEAMLWQPSAERIARVEDAIAKLPPKEGLGRPVNDLRKTQGRLQDLGLAGK